MLVAAAPANALLHNKKKDEGVAKQQQQQQQLADSPVRLVKARRTGDILPGIQVAALRNIDGTVKASDTIRVLPLPSHNEDLRVLENNLRVLPPPPPLPNKENQGRLAAVYFRFTVLSGGETIEAEDLSLVKLAARGTATCCQSP